MNLYIWRHNKTYHSHSMINEPCVVNEFYLDALAIVEAETLDDALKLLEERKEGWRVEDLRELEPIVFCNATRFREPMKRNLESK